MQYQSLSDGVENKLNGVFGDKMNLYLKGFFKMRPHFEKASLIKLKPQ